MIGRYTPALEQLRRERGLLDQAITALEHLNGERPMVSAGVSTFTAVADPAPTRKLLPSGTKRGRPNASAKVEVRHATRGGKTAPPTSRAIAPGGENVNGSDDDRVLRAVTSMGSATREQVMKATKLDVDRVIAARRRLEKRGAIVVKGWARASRWSLPAAKEAP